jgi:hypothetical protein
MRVAVKGRVHLERLFGRMLRIVVDENGQWARALAELNELGDEDPMVELIVFSAGDEQADPRGRIMALENVGLKIGPIIIEVVPDELRRALRAFE